jgi:hypothetical protein
MISLPRIGRLVVASAALFAAGCTVPERQHDQELIGWGEQSPFASLDLPAPNSIRTGSGRPGPDYWQQEVDYAIEAQVNTETHVLMGRETITYRNNSPDALPFIWLKLDANRCDPSSIASILDVPPLPFFGDVFDLGCRGGSGMTLERVATHGRPLAYEVYGTIARVDLPEPLASGGTFRLETSWHWTIPEYGYARTDREGTLYQVAQWYPRVAVYDDMHGWNVEPFLGPGEFYQEYGDFRVALTLPDNFVATATGMIDNPGEVLSSAQRERLVRAWQSDEAIPVITEAEALEGREREATGTKTWRFTADNVRDFAFAMAPDFRWDASTWNGILIQTFYRPEAELWEEANRMSWVTIRHFSERLAPYPWPHATTIEGPNGGMEYPMLTFVPTSTTREDLYWVLTHEFGHEWYPMLVNSNERLHPWMDEGFNSFIDIASVEEYFAGEAYADTIDMQPLHLYYEHAIPGREQAVALPPGEQVDLFWAAYFKPALMMHLLRMEVLGPERFDRAFSEYTKAWSFKHPYPADFFRFMEDAAGANLDWFWRGWIYTTARLDQSVERVTMNVESGETQVHLRSRGEMLMPMELSLTFEDGSSEVVRLPVQMWKLGPDYVYRLPDNRRLTGVEIDPRGVFPDDDRGNNTW